MFFPSLALYWKGEAITTTKAATIRFDNIAIGIKEYLQNFLKVVLADNIAPLVDEGFSIDSTQLSGIDIWTLVFFVIYFDFSAYSHIAVGSARLMGIIFPENFRFLQISLHQKISGQGGISHYQVGYVTIVPAVDGCDGCIFRNAGRSRKL